MKQIIELLKQIVELLKSVNFWTITGIIFTIFFGLAQMLKETGKGKETKPEVNLISRFDENPSHKTNFGFVSIDTYIDKGGNKIDVLLSPNLPDDDKFIIFIDFRNKLPGIITDANAKLEFPKSGTSSNATFKGVLAASNSKTITDTTT